MNTNGQLTLHDADPVPVAASDAESVLNVIGKMASDPNADATKFERLLSLYERIANRQAEHDYNTAMNAAQQEMEPVRQDASNPQTRSKYASFTALDNKIRPIYTKHGFSLSFDTADGAPEGHVRVVCKVSRGGHSERPHLDMPADGKGAKGGDVMTKTHATMSAVSYAKRGLLKMIFNITEGEADDDGNRAGGGNGNAISDEQVETIFDLIRRTKSDTVKFCAYFKIDAVPDLRAKDYTRAVEMLNMRGVKTASPQ